MQTLVVVPCGSRKIWATHLGAGPVPARDAYTGTPFKVNREYAETIGDDWVILSAKYGFLRPDDLIPGPYEVTFKRKNTDPVSVTVLREQIRACDLVRFDRVIGLGGVEYRQAMAEAFGLRVALEFPFAGMQLGYSLQAAKVAVASARRN